jgi:hypothetical protein
LRFLLVQTTKAKQPQRPAQSNNRGNNYRRSATATATLIAGFTIDALEGDLETNSD